MSDRQTSRPPVLEASPPPGDQVGRRWLDAPWGMVQCLDCADLVDERDQDQGCPRCDRDNAAELRDLLAELYNSDVASEYPWVRDDAARGLELLEGLTEPGAGRIGRGPPHAVSSAPDHAPDQLSLLCIPVVGGGERDPGTPSGPGPSGGAGSAGDSGAA